MSPEPGGRDAEALLRLHERRPDRYSVLLESVGGEPSLGRYNVLLALPGPSLVMRADGGLDGPGAATSDTDRFLDALDAWWRSETRVPDAGSAPFAGGWFLYLGYELAAEIEPSLVVPHSRLPRAGA